MAGDSPYWNPKTETLARSQLEALQLAKLRVQVRVGGCAEPVVPGSALPLTGFDVSSLRSLDDMRRMPLLTREEWMASQASFASVRLASGD